MKRKSRKEKRKSGPVLPVNEQERFEAKERKEEAKRQSYVNHILQ